MKKIILYVFNFLRIKRTAKTTKARLENEKQILETEKVSLTAETDRLKRNTALIQDTCDRSEKVYSYYYFQTQQHKDDLRLMRNQIEETQSQMRLLARERDNAMQTSQKYL